MLCFLDLLAKKFFETYCIFCVEKYKDLIMRVQNVNTNAQTQQNFKMNCTARVEKRVYDFLERNNTVDRANITQQLIDMIEVFKSGIAKLGKDTDEATLHIGRFSNNHINLFLNKKPLAHIPLQDYDSAEEIINQLFRYMPENALQYIDVIPKTSPTKSLWYATDGTNQVKRFNNQLICDADGTPKNHTEQEFTNIDDLTAKLKSISVLV